MIKNNRCYHCKTTNRSSSSLSSDWCSEWISEIGPKNELLTSRGNKNRQPSFQFLLQDRISVFLTYSIPNLTGRFVAKSHEDPEFQLVSGWFGGQAEGEMGNNQCSKEQWTKGKRISKWLFK